MQNIISLKIQGFRGFESSGVINLAAPNGKFGSGLTILVGPNSGGKSSIIEVLRAFSNIGQCSFTEGKRNKNASDKVSIEVKWNERFSGILKTVDAGGSETQWISTESVSPPQVYYLPARRLFEPFFGKSENARIQYSQANSQFQFRGQSLNNFSGRLFAVQKRMTEFSKLFDRIYGQKLLWTIDQSDNGNYYLKVNKSNLYHSSDGLGEGIISLLFLVEAIFEGNENDLIVIDEPELSLHPQLQRRFMIELGNYAKSHQVIIATHSPEMVNIDSVINGAKIHRVCDYGNGSEIFSLQDDTKEIFRSLESDLFNPHAFGYDSKLCFFAEERLVIVEGQEDVVFFNKMIEDLNMTIGLNFWGYGAGGAEKIVKIAKILKELGFRKIVAIYDGDKASEKEKFERLFPDYKCFILPADDIRDKVNSEGDVIKIGLYDVNKALKSIHESQCRLLLTEVNDCMV